VGVEEQTIDYKIAFCQWVIKDKTPMAQALVEELEGQSGQGRRDTTGGLMCQKKSQSEGGWSTHGLWHAFLKGGRSPAVR
jgi:hypothetical protein